MHGRSMATLFMALCLVCCCLSVHAAEKAVDVPEPGRLIAEMDPSWIIGTLTVSPDGAHVACVARGENKQFVVVVDGKGGKPHGGVGNNILVFSPDSKRVAYAAQVGARTKPFVVVDGKEEGQYDAIGTGSLTFSPDSTHVAYTVKARDKQFAVVDGREDSRYDQVTAPVFSPNSAHVAYGAKNGDQWSAVVDGKEGPHYDAMLRGGGIVFDSPDTLHYLAQNGQTIYLIRTPVK